MNRESKADGSRSPGARLGIANAVLLGCLPHVAITIFDGFFKESIYRHSALAFWMFDCFKFVVVTVAAVIWLYRSYSIAPAAYGFKSISKSGGWLRTIGATIFLTIVLYFIYREAQSMAWNILRPTPIDDFYKSIIPDGWLQYPVVLYYALTAGFTEEIFFRALPLLYVESRFGAGKALWWYVIVTSVLFAVAHWENGPHEVIATFIFGVVASLFYLKLKSIWPVIVGHTLIDFWFFI